MPPDTPHLPAPLAATQRRFEKWRSQRRPPSPIPPELWKAAVRCAGKYGIHRTIQTLRLEYRRLKLHMTASPGQGAHPSFVELSPAAMSGPASCIVEVERPGGAKLRVELRGSVPDLADLARRFALEGP